MDHGHSMSLRGQPTRPRHRPILIPILLIGAGALFLAQNFGVVSGDVWLHLWQYWPLLLILAGIDLVLGRSAVGGIAMLVVVVIAAAAVLWATTAGQVLDWSLGSWRSGIGVSSQTEQVVEELGGARSATVDLRHNAGRVFVAPLPGDSIQLVQADLSYPENREIERSVERRGDAAEVRLSDAKDSWASDVGSELRDWTVQLSPNIPVDLRVETGASQMSLDLRLLTIKNLDIQSGASEVNVTMPQEAGQTSARINAGAARVNVTVPEGVPARIRVDGAVPGAEIDQTRFPKAGQYYQSPDYDRSSNRLDLHVTIGVGGVTIR